MRYALHLYDRYELFFKLLKSGVLEQYYQIDPKNSWMVAAADAGIPVYCPGWEDSTSANICVSEKLRGNIKGYPVKNGLEQMEDLVRYALFVFALDILCAQEEGCTIR